MSIFSFLLHVKTKKKKKKIHRELTKYLLILFYRRYGKKCNGCAQGISPTDLVRKARDKVFHLNCFTCMICRKQLSTGEELYVLEDNKFICKDDYMSGKNSQGTRRRRRRRRCYQCAYLTRARVRTCVVVFIGKRERERAKKKKKNLMKIPVQVVNTAVYYDDNIRVAAKRCCADAAQTIANNVLLLSYANETQIPRASASFVVTFKMVKKRKKEKNICDSRFFFLFFFLNTVKVTI